MELNNRSITDDARREAIRFHLLWLAAQLDDDSLDHQLLTLKYELMASTNDDLATELRGRAEAVQANKVDVEEES